MVQYGNLDVEVEALKDVASGLMEQLSYMGVCLNNMSFYVTELKDSWQSDNYKKFSKTYAGNEGDLKTVFRELRRVTGALKSTAEEYEDFERLLIEDAAKLKA